MLIEWVLLFPLLVAVGYAHWRLPYHTASRGMAMFSRLLLLVVGFGVGWSALVWARDDPGWYQTVAFLTGFGLVHVPAAFILWSKRLRGVDR